MRNMSKSKRFLLMFLGYVLVLLVCQLTFVALNTAAQTLPRETIARHIDDSEESPIFQRIFNHDYKVMGSTVSYDNNRYIKSIASQKEYATSFETFVRATIIDYFKDGAPYTFDYFRYWHGWQLLTNLSFTFGDVLVLQTLVFLLTALSVALFLVNMKHYIGWSASVLFALLAFFSTNIFGNFLGDITLSISVFSSVFFCAAILFVGRTEWRNKTYVVGLLCLIAGAVFNFLDFLTVPAFILALVVFCAMLALKDPSQGWRSSFKFFALCSLSFLAGFAFTWITKWLLMAAVMGLPEVISNITYETGRWTITDTASLSDNHVKWLFDMMPRVYPIIASAGVVILGNPAGVLALVATVGLILYCALTIARAKRRCGYRLSESNKSNLFLCLPVVFVFLYYVVMNMHASFHLLVFSYKPWGIVFAILACMSLVIARDVMARLEKGDLTAQIH